MFGYNVWSKFWTWDVELEIDSNEPETWKITTWLGCMDVRERSSYQGIDFGL